MTLLGLLVAFHAFVAWAPFEFDPPARVDNAVTVTSEGALEISGRRAIAHAASPAAEGAAPPGEVTINMEVEPADGDQRGPARLLAWSGSHRDANLMIGQWQDDLIVRIREADSNRLGRPALVVEDAFERGEPLAIEVALTDEHARVSVDGHEPVERSRPADGFETWDLSHGLALGDERRAPRVWHGRIEVAHVQVDGVTTDLLADGVLTIPERVWYVPARVVEMLEVPPESAQLRSVLHFVGFVPVGWLLVGLVSPGVRLRRVALLALAFTVLLQLGKTSIEPRHPSFLDMGAHVGGATFGATFALWASDLRMWLRERGAAFAAYAVRVVSKRRRSGRA
ncbi:hypothetical protein ER308_12275 [Egibacter rhizosphaerae]|uniref:VanZ family protein n=1 Tax=Egibacter rhizosphaerae TaxID=1670831 RepID=A0A411YG65_9ACTN|nr:hypothetical protein [Egibacter rhizosphaerae]QBI20265.1 hypothetical protein ER308_12275 [Egibacter rhizosphaerae]